MQGEEAKLKEMVSEGKEVPEENEEEEMFGKR